MAFKNVDFHCSTNTLEFTIKGSKEALGVIKIGVWSSHILSKLGPCVGFMFSLIPALWNKCCFCFVLFFTSKRMPGPSELLLKMFDAQVQKSLRVHLLSSVMGTFSFVTQASVK